MVAPQINQQTRPSIPLVVFEEGMTDEQRYRVHRYAYVYPHIRWYTVSLRGIHNGNEESTPLRLNQSDPARHQQERMQSL